MSDYYCKDCEFLNDKSKGNFIDGYCKKYNQSLTFYDWFEKCDKCVIETLQEENAALRERLEKAVELPFRTGHELYMIDDFNHSNVWKGKCDGIEVMQTRIPQQLLFYVYASFEDPETRTLRTRKFTNETLNEIYTTREVAEARLAELKGESHETTN